MKTTLNQSLVLRLTLEQKPISETNGSIVFEPNTSLKPYILFDGHRDSPTGFGVKISHTKKTYIFQRRVGEKIIKTKIGNVSDFLNIDAARKKAAELIHIAKNTGRNPNAVAREKNANEITLSEAFDQYRLHLLGRPKPAKINTLIVFDKALDRLSVWKNRRLKDISSKEILEKFDSIAQLHRTAAEQTFRWANVATNYIIEIESHNAASQQRQSTLSYNPFSILKTNKKFRTRTELEESYKAKGVRNPLTMSNMTEWLNAILLRRNKNRTGSDYLLLCTLWGTRKNEATDLLWRDKISTKEAMSSSWVDLENKTVHFHDTKNRSNHDLPLADGAYEILLQRRENSDDDKKSAEWVFPAQSKYSKTGHYTDMKTLVNYVCEDANIKRLGLHDLRRTFGRIAEELTSYAVVKRLLNHQALSDATSRYTEVSWDRLSEAMQRIELHILARSPTAYNLLLTPKHEPLHTDITD